MKGLFIGLTAVDIIYPLTAFPRENEKIRATGEIMDVGGPATNAAFAFSALGGEATLVSWVGKHALTGFINDKLASYGLFHLDLNVNYEKDPIVSCVMLNTSTGSRTIVTSQVNMNIPIIPPNLDPGLFDIICVDGFYGQYVIKFLRKNNKSTPVILDGGSYKVDTDAILPWVTYPLLSDHFVPPDNLSAVEYLESFGFKKYAITRGEKPISVYNEHKAFELSVPPIMAVDTLAAGDIFHGAFAKFIIDEDCYYESALLKAASVATRSCEFIGPRKWAEDYNKER